MERDTQLRAEQDRASIPMERDAQIRDEQERATL
jgi:hypothetical protein